MMGLQVDIFEKKELVVRHVFYGQTEKECFQVANAHELTDAFYEGAVNRNEWNGIPLTIDYQWVKGTR